MAVVVFVCVLALVCTLHSVPVVVVCRRVCPAPGVDLCESLGWYDDLSIPRMSARQWCVSGRWSMETDAAQGVLGWEHGAGGP